MVYRACQTQPLENASYCAVDPLQCNLWRFGIIVLFLLIIARPIYVQYSVDIPVLFRREGLKTKGIDCDCERCSDGSEAGTG